jgi:hypothetical protein
MRTIYLHFGFHKTGTSSIQLSLHRSRDRLRECGLSYPGCKVNHAELHLLFSGRPETHPDNLKRGVATVEDAARANREYREALAKELRSDSNSKMILSAEGLGLLTLDELRSLRAFLSEFADEIHAVCLVRSPVKFAMSYAQELVAGGRTLEEVTQHPTLPCYRQKLEGIAAVFGLERLTVRNYDAICKGTEPLIREFIRMVGEDPARYDFLSDERANTCLSLEAVLILDRLNKALPLFKDDKRNEARATLPRAWLQRIGSRRFTMPRSWQHRIHERCESDTQWLGEIFNVRFADEDIYVAHHSSSVIFDGSLADDVGSVLHHSAALVEQCFKEALTLRSRLAELEGNRDLAVQSLEAALTIDPNQPAVRHRLSTLQGVHP